MNHTANTWVKRTMARRERCRRGPMVCTAAATLSLCLALLAVAGSARLAPSPAVAHAVELRSTLTPASLHPGADLRVDDFYIHVPAGAPEPLQPLVALPGMGGAGEDFAQAIQAWTDPEGWVIVAPTFRYGDWRDPAQVTREAGDQLPRITAFLDRLPELTGLAVRPQALLYGYSRGSQTANRFALAYPERVAAAAIMSAGTYTLPAAAIRSGQSVTALRFPYGVANFVELFGKSFDSEAFTRVPFWIGVGARDSDPADVPHQWDPYIGADRVERAQRFAAWLQAMGANAEVHVFPGVGHGESDAVRAAAMSFLAGLAPS